MSSNKNDIRIVLVHTTHPGNIGAAARAMKNMGLSQLVLVNPACFPHVEATARASGADDLLARARVVPTLEAALEGCVLVVGSSARMRGISCPVKALRPAAEEICGEARQGAIAILFGQESSGLTNAELAHCHWMVTIPTNPAYPSLNLAQAVQLVCYELAMATPKEQAEVALPAAPEAEALAAADEMHSFYQHLQDKLIELGFLNPANPRKLMQRLTRLFNRARLEKRELNILRGILSAIPSPVAARQPTEAQPIYLDYMATTPVDARVHQEMNSYLEATGAFGNPASRAHVYGMRAAQAVEHARAQLAALVMADPNEIIWTSGATEANNLALQGAAYFYQRKGKHIITLATEHKSVLDVCQALERKGFRVTYLTPSPNGLLDLAQLEAALTTETLLVSIMHVNNEIGVIQNIPAIAALTRSRGILLHVDAAQSLGKISVDLQQWPVDLMSFSAHKMYGPKGIGALYVRRQPRVRLQPLLFGGGQEQGLRAGTLATHQIVGMGEACAIAQEEMVAEQERILQLRERLWAGIKTLPEVYLNGDWEQRVAGNLNVSFNYVAGESLLMALSDVAVASGSACTSASLEPSHVLLALGCAPPLAQSAVRFSIGRYTTGAEIDLTIERVHAAVNRLRALSPLWEG